MKNRPILMILITAVGLGVIFFAVLVVATLVSGGRSSKQLAPLPGMDKVALVKIEGLLVNADHIVEEINGHADDSSIKAILVRVDSPGGGVVVSQEIYNALLNAK